MTAGPQNNDISGASVPAVQDSSQQRMKAPGMRWAEPVTALIMALAALGTAWSSYESAAWTRRSQRLMNEFNSLERRAGVLTVQGTQTATIHVALFTEALAAQQAGRTDLVNFLVQRFPPELRKAYDAWIKQKPFENPSADPHPFVPKLYEMRSAREVEETNKQAATRIENARAAGTISGQYLANTVLFATVLVFANAAIKFQERRVRIVSFYFAIAVFAFVTFRLIILPI